MPPRTHDGKGPPPKRAKKTPANSSPELISRAEVAEAMKALEEKRSAEKAKKEREAKKSSAKKRETAAKTPPQPTVSADDAWKDLDDSDGEMGGLKPFNLMPSIGEDAADIITDSRGEQHLGNLTFDGRMTRARRAASQSEASGETENDVEPESNQVAIRSKRSAEKEQTEIQKLAQAINASRSKITSKMKKYHDALEKNGKKNENFREAHMKFKKIGKDKKSPEILEFREVFLKMIGDNKDKFADISWDTGKTKTEYVGRTSPFHSGKKEEYVVNHNTGETKMRYAKEPRQVKVYNSVIHELAQFLRDTATYIDSKDIEADKIMEEIVEERRIYAENREKKKDLEEAEWDEQMGL